MGRWPIIFGYAGTAPFILFFLLCFISDSENSQTFISSMHMSYTTMALSFLAGVHWGQAIPSGNMRQMKFAMLLPLAAFALVIWSIIFDPYLPLLAAVGLFWGAYKMDLHLMPLEYIPDGYLKYRFRLTAIVSASLVLSFLVLISR